VSKSSDAVEHALGIGYSQEDLRCIPEGVVCRGCGNPIAHAELKEGETVLDLGCGAGWDAFLAARKVGPQGKVIGIDRSAETIAEAKRNAAKEGCLNVAFQLGNMDQLPVGDQSFDAVVSNCVINYSPSVSATFREVFRCLRPDGRMVVADLVTAGPFAPEILEDQLWGAWLARAVGKREYLSAIQNAGFRQIEVVSQTSFGMAERDERLRGKIVSLLVRARK